MKSKPIPINEFSQNAASKRACMKFCMKCKKEITKTDTKFAHMVQVIENKKQVTRFYCDECKRDQDNKN